MRRPFMTRAVAACLLLTLAACTSWQPYTVQPGAELPERLWLELSSGEEVTLRSPSLLGDSAVVGEVMDPDPTGTARTIPMSAVAQAEYPESSGLSTPWKIVIGTGVLALG